MGTELTGACKCGYGDKVYIGSGRASHGKLFKYPHSCNTCNSLTSVDMLAVAPSCSHCNSKDIRSYAANTKTLSYKSLLNRFPTELLAKTGYHRTDVVHDESFCYPIKKTYVFLRGNHHCPRCNENTMTFFTSMLYD
jgi:ribosomal protein L37AE/L43A